MRINWLLAGEVELDPMVINPGASGIQLQVHKSITERVRLLPHRARESAALFTLGNIALRAMSAA